MLIDFGQVTAIQRNHYLHLLFTIPFSSIARRKLVVLHAGHRLLRWTHSRERWSVCRGELISPCDCFAVKGDGHTVLDEMNTQRSVMNNKPTAMMSNYTSSHISSPQTRLRVRGARERLAECLKLKNRHDVWRRRCYVHRNPSLISFFNFLVSVDDWQFLRRWGSLEGQCCQCWRTGSVTSAQCY